VCHIAYRSGFEFRGKQTLILDASPSRLIYNAEVTVMQPEGNGLRLTSVEMGSLEAA
jgi:hypothetical protein